MKSTLMTEVCVVIAEENIAHFPIKLNFIQGFSRMAVETCAPRDYTP